jgi:hypothetical protein
MNEKVKKIFFNLMDKEYPNFDFSNCEFTISFRMNYSAMRIGSYVISVFTNDIPIDRNQDRAPTFVMLFNCMYDIHGIHFELIETSDSHSIFISKLLSLDWLNTMNFLEEWFKTKNINHIIQKLTIEVGRLLEKKERSLF